MSSYALEILADFHDRAGFASGLESVDRYLRETARGHLLKGVSVTRVLVEKEAAPPKQILGYFTLSNITVEPKGWPGTMKGLPRQPLSAVLLGRLAISKEAQGRGLGTILVAAASQLARETIHRTGGIGMVVDAANEELVAYYGRFGFVRVAPASLRMFLPESSLATGFEIPKG